MARIVGVYDKAFQIIVLNTGQAGCNGEHSPVDALTTGRICIEAVMSEPASDPQDAISTIASLERPRHLKWAVDAGIMTTIKTAEKMPQVWLSTFTFSLAMVWLVLARIG